MPDTYYIRRFFGDGRPAETGDTGLSLDEAQAHCQDPETSSATATNPEAIADCVWFDGYEKESA